MSASALPKKPSTTDEFAALVRAAAEEGSQVRVAGSNSLPLTRFNPERAAQDISTLRLNKVLEHAVSDMTVIVHAGITLEALQRHLAWHNQWLPVDPPVIARQAGRTPLQRTIGGLIATSSLGPLRFGMGDWRLFVMGMRWIDANGTVIKGGGRTVKNVAGYSTPRLMIGSCGALGAIAEVTLRTFARPADEQCVIFFCNGVEQAESLLAEVLSGGGVATTPAYLQAVGARTFAGNPLQLPSPKNGIALAVGFLDRPHTCAAQIEALRSLPAAKGVESISQTAAQAGRLRLWMTTEPALDTLAEMPAEAPGVGFRVHCLSSEVCRVITQLEAAAKGAKVASWLAGEAASGVVRGAIAAANGMELLERVLSEHAPGSHFLLTQGEGARAGENEGDIVKRIKRELDPAETFGFPPL